MNNVNIFAASAVWKRAVGLMACLCCCFSIAGCSKGKKEPKITGRPSDPPVSLHCAWKPGLRYRLRLELDTLTDLPIPGTQETDLHRVSFAQECLVTATEARAGNVSLDMEILSVAMERAKGSQVAVSFDSEQGGETADDAGYIPVLKKLPGGHLRFLISPDGKMLKADGIAEWLARALDETPGRAAAPKILTSTSILSNAPSLATVPPTNGLPKIIRKVGRNMFAPGAASPPNNRRGPVSTALHGFFTPELFRQMLEFKFLPGGPVRIGEEWAAKGDIPVNGRVQFRFDARGKFSGWQQHSDTNCARIEVRGALSPQGGATPAPASNPPKNNLLQATLWINQELGFPMNTVLNTQAVLSNQTTVKIQGTNNVVTNSPPRSVRQSVAVTLLEITPVEAVASDAATTSQ